MNWQYSEDRKRILLDEPPKRTKKITGHRFPSILGLNKYQTPFGAWCEITGLVKLPFEDNKFTIAGKTIEPKQIDYVRNKFPNIKSCEEYYGNSFEEYRYSNFKDLGRIFDGVRDFVSTKNDGKTIMMVGECKTSSKPQDWENNNVPLDYLCQGMLYAYLDGLDKILYVTSFLQPMDYNDPSNYIVSDSNTKLTVKKLSECMLPISSPDPIWGYTDYYEINGLIRICENWWEHYVETGISPEFDEVKDKEYLDIIRASKPSNDNDLSTLCIEGINLAKEIKELEVSSGLKAKKDELKIIENCIKEKLIENNLDCCEKYKLKRTVKLVLNENRLEKEDNKIYNKYCEEKITYTLSKDLKEEE
jgi:predicted phage-related endonuclease